MAVTTTQTNKPLNPRGNDQSPLAYNRAKLFSGKALSFDGVNDILTMPTALTSSLSTTTITHVLNFKTDFSSFASSRDDVFSYSERGIIFTFNFGSIVVYYRHSGGSWGAITIPTDKIKLQEWNHCAIVIDYNNDLGKVYINGHEVVGISSLAGANIAYDSNALTIGAQAGSKFFDGQIAGFKIFNTALTAAQVADLYNNPEKVVPTGVDNTALKLWLPMQEGAGTTAYDGSGNGNHGTISGATYTHGIGAPVAQTAVIDWNKGTNLTLYSEDGSVWGTGGNAPTITQDQPDPFEGTRAQRIQMDKASNYAQIVKQHTQISASVQYTAKMWLKAVSGTPTIAINYNGSGGSWQNVTLTNEWAEYEVTRTMNADYEYSHNILIGNPAPGTSSTADFYIYGLQIQLGDTAGPYVPTFGTAQTSEVLLPQGLTTGRDITGVNLFENVRKQGALNLDGNSWAEVHDNESLDFGTGSFSLEAWAKASHKAQGSVLNTIMVLGGNSATGTTALNITNSLVPAFYYDTTSRPAQSGSQNEGDWFHIVGVYDETNITIYINGQQDGQSAKIAIDLTNTLVKYIGRDSTTVRYYQNCIAQPRIYNRALTAEEVQRNYNAGKNIYTN